MPGPIGLPPTLDAPVNMLRLYPGMPRRAAARGAGRAGPGPGARGLRRRQPPRHRPELLETLAEGARRGVVVLVVSQCVDGRVDLGAYATSGPLVAAGAVGGLDMTTEAAYAKLVVLLSEGHPPDEVRALLARDLAGELTA